jgi:aryl-alcohol dehydrogenase-like predicted oxidoreductase
MTGLQPLGATGLRCHPLGFGCYRIVDGNAQHESALRRYLAKGGNLIDTSANYGDGASEELVGKVLAGLPRDRVIVVTKGGYMQGQNMALAEQRRFPEVVEYGPGIWHCIHPEFLATQIERSCRLMEQDYIDLYLLHNPEYYLEDMAHRRALTMADHDEFYRRIREAFRFLEQKVADGVIGWYGVSSNNFGQPAVDVGSRCTTATSVARCWDEAEAISPDHHFRVVQLPLNLYEPGGALDPNNAGQTLLEFCASKGMGVLANRPLNAFQNNQLIRLADWGPPGSAPPGVEQLRQLLEPLSRLEGAFELAMGQPITLETDETMSELFLRVVPQLHSVSQWQQAAPQHIVDPIQAWLLEARQRHGQDPVFEAWLEQFVARINPVFEAVQRQVAARQQGVSDGIRAKLLAAGYPPAAGSLSQMALHVLTSLKGLSCVLVGMRRNEYVEDSMSVAARGPVDGLSILGRFSSRSTLSS